MNSYNLKFFNDYVDTKSINESNINTINEGMVGDFFKNVIGSLKGGLKAAFKDPKNKELIDSFMKNVGATTFGEKYMRGASRQFFEKDIESVSNNLASLSNKLNKFKKMLTKFNPESDDGKKVKANTIRAFKIIEHEIKKSMKVLNNLS